MRGNNLDLLVSYFQAIHVGRLQVHEGQNLFVLHVFIFFVSNLILCTTLGVRSGLACTATSSLLASIICASCPHFVTFHPQFSSFQEVIQLRLLGPLLISSIAPLRSILLPSISFSRFRPGRTPRYCIRTIRGRLLSEVCGSLVGISAFFAACYYKLCFVSMKMT
jgi:hypothetical protein